MSLASVTRILQYTCAALAVLCLLCCIALPISRCHTDQAEPDTQPPAQTDAIPTGTTESVILPQTDDAGLAYQDKLTFVGDSLTAHLVSRGVLSGGKETHQVWRSRSYMINLDSEVTAALVCIPGTDRYVTIAEAAGELRPEILVVTLGTDYGVAYLDREEFKYCYTKLLKAIRAASPDTRVILQSIFPVTDYCTVLTNDRIDTANEWVKEVAAENGCRYLDTQSVLKGDDNCLIPSLCNDSDGIHLTAEAYRRILDYIRTHAVG